MMRPMTAKAATVDATIVPMGVWSSPEWSLSSELWWSSPMIGLWRGVRNRYGHYITLAFSFQQSMEVFVLDHGVVKRGGLQIFGATNEVRFLLTHNQGLHRLFVKVSWDLRV